MSRTGFTRRGMLGLVAAAAYSQSRNKEISMSNPLPLRPNAHQESPELWKRWNAMFADTSARNLDGQRQLHAEMCAPSKDCDTGKPIGNVHKSPDFVLWHRAFLYYHEQILSALGGSAMGLPYWDWSVDRLCPPAYDAKNFKFGANLDHSTQKLGDENFSADHIAGVVALLRNMPPEEAAVQLFDQPIHMLVHSRLGWDHANDLKTAAGDPLFYGHHANLDRLASHIFQGGWPKPSGISYRFIGPDGKEICTTLDKFATMPSPYEGEQPIDTSSYTVKVIDDVPSVLAGGYSRVQTQLRFPRPLKMGRYRLVSGKGTQLGEIASIDHHGSVDFILWLTPENYRKAREEGVRTALENVPASLARAVLVTNNR